MVELEVVTFVAIAVLLGAWMWGRKFWAWRWGNPERSSADFWKWPKDRD